MKIRFDSIFLLSRRTREATMNRCAAVRKKGATDQCPIPAMKGHTMCRRHAGARVAVLWKEVHKASPVVRMQALVRGWLLRRRLVLAGPGVLFRKDLVNDEDVFTCESKDRQYPLNYFAFEEAGKIYWFDAASLWQWTSRSVSPLNPYTKTPLTNDTRKRLREWGWRNRVSFDSDTINDKMSRRWNVIVQIFRENGFVDTHPEQFSNFDISDYRTMFVFLERDLQIVLPEKDINRARLLRICRRGQKGDDTDVAPVHKVFLLFHMLSIPKDPYVLVFSILSAFIRC